MTRRGCSRPVATATRPRGTPRLENLNRGWCWNGDLGGGARDRGGHAGAGRDRRHSLASAIVVQVAQMIEGWEVITLWDLGYEEYQQAQRIDDMIHAQMAEALALQAQGQGDLMHRWMVDEVGARTQLYNTQRDGDQAQAQSLSATSLNVARAAGAPSSMEYAYSGHAPRLTCGFSGVEGTLSRAL